MMSSLRRFLLQAALSQDRACGYMLEGIQRGVLTMARVDEAITRILALKASLGLWNKVKEAIIPPAEAAACIGCAEHHAWARQCADEAITLVKDTQNALPLDPKKTPRLLLEVLGGCPSEKRIADHMTALLEKEGFTVTLYEPEDFTHLEFKVESFHEKYDAVLYLGNVENASNKTTNRINWYTMWGAGNNVPWFVHEVPTVFASLANPYHLVDVPMMKTYINCYSNNAETLDALVEKLMGRDTFRGVSPVDPFCGKEHLKY